MSAVKKLLQNIEHQPLPWLVQILASIFFIGNLYMASQLFPLIRNIDSLVSRVSAIEERNEKVDPLVERFFQLEERDKSIVEELKEIKESIKDLNRAHGLVSP